MARKKTIQVRDLFVEPNFNELDDVALDSKETSNIHCLISINGFILYKIEHDLSQIYTKQNQ
jgi:hypothetical protein